MILVVTLTVRRAAAESFRAFETAAARIMARHGGAIERTVRVDPDASADTFREVHVLNFPDEAALAAYRADPELAGLSSLRAEAVVSTEVLVGVEGPTYR